ncbi:MAG: hypothetical protein R2879_07725 [Saprospiraceae bacterium]
MKANIVMFKFPGKMTFDIRNGKLIFYLFDLGIIIYLGIIGFHGKALKGIAIISIGLFFVLFPKSNIGAKSILISKNGIELHNFFSRKSIKPVEISNIEVAMKMNIYRVWLA